jgi:hypothetical protein
MEQKRCQVAYFALEVASKERIACRRLLLALTVILLARSRGKSMLSCVAMYSRTFII